MSKVTINTSSINILLPIINIVLRIINIVLRIINIVLRIIFPSRPQIFRCYVLKENIDHPKSEEVLLS